MSALGADLTLSGFPHVLLRVGYSSEPDPTTVRGATASVIRLAQRRRFLRCRTIVRTNSGTWMAGRFLASQPGR